MSLPKRSQDLKSEATGASSKRRRGAGPIYTAEQWVIGIGGTVLAHVLVVLFLMLGNFSGDPVSAANPYRDFSIELETPEEPEEEKPIYTQTNPDAPDNEPDETDRFGSRNQQAANEEKPEELDPDNRPANESDDTLETDQVLSGSLYDPIPPAAQSESPEEAQDAAEERASPAQVPLPEQPLLAAFDEGGRAVQKEIPLFGSEEEAEDESGLAEHVYDQLEEAPTNILDFSEGELEEEEGKAEETIADNPDLIGAPRPRPTLEAIHNRDGVPLPRARPQLPRLPSGPTRDSRLGVSSLGQVAVDAKASKFGEYMDRLVETVKLNWDNLVERSSAEERKSVVKIRFMLNHLGQVSDIEVLEGTTSRVLGRHMCIEAIQRGVPYGPWPEGLIEVFGEEEDITFVFQYF